MSRKYYREDTDRFYELDLHIPTRTIYMGSSSYMGDDGEEESGTDFAMAESVIKGLLVLESLNKDPITLIMNNLGGYIYHGLAIFDAIRQCKSRVTIIVYGQALSMGSWILQAADERIMLPHATMMLHYGYHGKFDHYLHMAAEYKESQRMIDLMTDTYLERIKEADPKFTKQKLHKMLSVETYLSAQEAVELGLADKVME